MIFSFFILSCGNNYEKTITVKDLTNGSWYMETSTLNEVLNKYMKSRGVYDRVSRKLEFNGDGKSGTVRFYESIGGGESCAMTGKYVADSSSGSLKITISGLQNNNGYCSYYKNLNGLYVYNYVLYSDIDTRFAKTYSGKKTLSLWKENTREIIFQKDVK